MAKSNLSQKKLKAIVFTDIADFTSISAQDEQKALELIQKQNEIIGECLQLHGGAGFMNECPISHMYRDARVQTIYGGTNEITKDLISRTLDS